MIAPSVEVKFAGFNAEEHPVTVAGVRAGEVHLIQPALSQERLRLRYYIIYSSITDIQHIVANLDFSLELGENSDDAFNLQQCHKGSQIIVTLDFRPGSPQKKPWLQFFSVTKGQCQISPLDSESLAIPSRYCHAMVGLGKSEVLIAGGYSPETGQVLDDCYVVDTETQTARPVASLPRPLYASSLTLVGNKVYLFGGASSALPIPNLATLSGSQSGSQLGSPPDSLDKVANGSASLQLSPSVPSTPFPRKMHNALRTAVTALSDEVFVYDIATDSWEQLETQPCSRPLVSLLPKAPPAARSPGEAADRRRSSSDHLSDVPAARFGHSAIAIFDRYLIVFGGRFSKVCADDMFMLDTQTLTWTRVDLVGTAPSHRSGATLIFDGFRCLYVYSGRNSFNSFADCFAIDLAKGSVTAPDEYREELCIRFFAATRECYQGVVSARDKRYDSLRAEAELKTAKLMEALQSSVRKAKGLEKERDKLSADLSASQEAGAEQQRSIERLEAEVERLESHGSQLASQLTGAMREVTELKTQLSTAGETASRLTRTIEEKDALIAELKSSLKDSTDEVASLKTELVGRDASLAERDREKLELNYSCQELDRQKADLLATNSALEVELFASREELTRLQAVERRYLRIKEEYRRLLGDMLSLNDKFDEQEATMLASSINADRSLNASFNGGMSVASSSGISGAAPGALGSTGAGLQSNLRRRYPIAVPGLPAGRDTQLTPSRGPEGSRIDRERPASARGPREASWITTSSLGAGGSSRSPEKRAALHSSLVSGGPDGDVLGASLNADTPVSAPTPSQPAQPMQPMQAGSPIQRTRVPGILPDEDTPDDSVTKQVSGHAEATRSGVFGGTEIGTSKGLLNTVVSPIQSLGN